MIDMLAGNFQVVDGLRAGPWQGGNHPGKPATRPFRPVSCNPSSVELFEDGTSSLNSGSVRRDCAVWEKPRVATVAYDSRR